jgi:hypothetical protein
MSDDAVERVSRTRVRPRLRRFAIIAFAILLPVAGHRLWDYIEMRRLVREVDAIIARGEPVTESDRRAGDPGRAGAYYLAAALLLPADDVPRARETRPSVVLAPLYDWLAGVGPPPVRRDIVGRLQPAVDESQDALALADKASALPFEGFLPGSDFSYRAARVGALAHLIGVRSVVAALSGQSERAVDSAIGAIRAGRALRAAGWRATRNPEIPAILSLSAPSAEALRRLQEALEEEDVPERGLDMLVAERARYLETNWRRYYGSNPATPRHYTLPMRSLPETLLRPWLTHRLIGTLRLWAELIEVARVPWPEKARASAEILRKYPPPARMDALRPWPSPATVLLPLFRQAISPDTLVADRCTRVAVSVERFRRDHAGALPATLQDLVPTYLASVPLDPLSGAPLLYRTNPEAYTIYSIGTNQQDDGGDLTSEWRNATTAASGFRAIRGADLGIRVLIHP